MVFHGRLLLAACHGQPLYVDKSGRTHSGCKTCVNRKHHRRQRESRRRRGLRPRPYTRAYFSRRRRFIVGKRCQWCAAIENLTVDHIQEISRGGKLLDTTNWRVLCVTCHTERTRASHRAASLTA